MSETVERQARYCQFVTLPERSSAVEVAAKLNGRPRETLGSATPAEMFAALIDGLNRAAERNQMGGCERSGFRITSRLGSRFAAANQAGRSFESPWRCLWILRGAGFGALGLASASLVALWAT